MTAIGILVETTSEYGGSLWQEGALLAVVGVVVAFMGFVGARRNARP